jgi:hypothetical protein
VFDLPVRERRGVLNAEPAIALLPARQAWLAQGLAMVKIVRSSPARRLPIITSIAPVLEAGEGCNLPGALLAWILLQEGVSALQG